MPEAKSKHFLLPKAANNNPQLIKEENEYE
jgi:hypothetical protein